MLFYNLSTLLSSPRHFLSPTHFYRLQTILIVSPQQRNFVDKSKLNFVDTNSVWSDQSKLMITYTQCNNSSLIDFEIKSYLLLPTANTPIHITRYENKHLNAQTLFASLITWYFSYEIFMSASKYEMMCFKYCLNFTNITPFDDVEFFDF